MTAKIANEAQAGRRRLRLYLVGLLVAAAALELSFRYLEPVLFDACYRPLFKAALLEEKGPVDVLFFGTSRTGEALRPSVFDAELSSSPSSSLASPPIKSFNLSVQYSNIEVLDYLSNKFATRPGLKLAIVELSRSAAAHGSLAWQEPLAPAVDFDGRAWNWFESHSRLVALRKVFVLESFSRLLAVLAFSRFFDGSEQFGGDYVAALLGHRDSYPHDYSAQDWQYRTWHCCDQHELSQPASAPNKTLELPPFEGEARTYARIAERFQQAGVPVVFYVPPVSEGRNDLERPSDFQAFIARVSTLSGRPIWDFSSSHTPGGYFRDTLHLNHEGGTKLSRIIAGLVKDSRELSLALGRNLDTKGGAALHAVQ